jgi:flagellar export protein FliJ
MKAEDWVPMDGPTINPLKRNPISVPLDVGIRSINGLLTVGRGQRLGLFAGTGVGKSVLLGMMTRFTEADIIVVGLIGERGREVKEFIEHILGEEGLKRSVVVASPADDAPLMRLRAAMYCTRIAEYFRDKGKNVLLLMDSLTRFAQAQREIALAIGEPPATKGYPPSVFAKLPKLVERAGNAEAGGGSITAFYTVLSEGDDQQDPIADSARGVLDGHIVLSRRLAEEGHYPAIDIEASISRVMPSVVSAEHMRRAQQFKQLWSRFQQARDLISVGAYVAGRRPRNRHRDCPATGDGGVPAPGAERQYQPGRKQWPSGRRFSPRHRAANPMASGGRAARLAPVVDMAESAEKAAAQRLGHFQGQVNLANSKLGDLENFRGEYQRNGSIAAARACPGNGCATTSTFSTSLESAVGQQRQSLVWHQNNLDKARETWQQAYAGSRACANWCSATPTKRGSWKTSANKS